MEKSNERQDLIAGDTGKAKEKLVDMIYSALVRMSYWSAKGFSDAVDDNGMINEELIKGFKSNEEAYKSFFYVLLSVYGKIENTEQDIDLNKLIENEIENYNFESLRKDSSIENFDYKKETENIIKNEMFDRKMDVELYTDNMHESTMPTFILSKENWAMKNLRAILNGDTVEIKKINLDYPDENEYNAEYVAANERYNEVAKIVNNVIERYNSLFHDSNGKIIQKNDGEEFIAQKYMNCKPQFNLSILNTLINDAGEIKKENKVDEEIFDKMSLISKRISTLRDCIVLERDLKEKFNDIDTVVNNAFAVINESVENQISNIVIKVGNVDQNAPFKRTLFLINSRCSDELQGNVLSKLNNPDRDFINKFINNKNFIFNT